MKTVKPTLKQILNATKEDIRNFDLYSVKNSKLKESYYICNVCDYCDSCSGCYSCDSCESCKFCLFCYNCHSCESCHSCKLCESCDSCTYCDNCDNCAHCNCCKYCYGIVNGYNLKYVVCGRQLTTKQYNKFIAKLR